VVDKVRAGVVPPDEVPAKPFAVATDTAVTVPVAQGMVIVVVSLPESSVAVTHAPTKFNLDLCVRAIHSSSIVCHPDDAFIVVPDIESPVPSVIS
jgi:hypothetical protein